jgi:hypothetical protein
MKMGMREGEKMRRGEREKRRRGESENLRKSEMRVLVCTRRLKGLPRRGKISVENNVTYQ